MSNGNGDKETWVVALIKGVTSPTFITALGALILSTAGVLQGCLNHERIDRHADEISQNKQAIGAVKEKAEVAAKEADVAKDKAVTVENKVEKLERKTDK